MTNSRKGWRRAEKEEEEEDGWERDKDEEEEDEEEGMVWRCERDEEEVSLCEEEEEEEEELGCRREEGEMKGRTKEEEEEEADDWLWVFPGCAFSFSSGWARKSTSLAALGFTPPSLLPPSPPPNMVLVWSSGVDME